MKIYVVTQGVYSDYDINKIQKIFYDWVAQKKAEEET